MTETTLPTIDLQPLRDGTNEGLNLVSRDIRRAYTETGFSYLINHGVPQGLTEKAFEAGRRFHTLPLKRKMAIETNRWHRGYIPINTSTIVTSSIAKVTKPNQSESFMMMHDLPDDDPDVLAGKPLAGPNQWPPSCPGFRETVMQYNDTLRSLCQMLMPAVSVALGGAPADLRPYFKRPTTFLRLLHYPAIAGPRDEDLYGSAPHTDYGFITVLAQDEAGGLQVRPKGGEWIDAPPIPGAFIMNTGDITARWSNNRFLSTPHRVYNRQNRDRYSMAFFYDPNMDSRIACLPSCADEANPPRYESVVYGDYLMERLNANHAYRHKV